MIHKFYMNTDEYENQEEEKIQSGLISYFPYFVQ